MPLVRNVDPRKVALEIDATGQVVESGDTAEVSDELAASLCEQSGVWAAADTTTAPAPTTEGAAD